MTGELFDPPGMVRSVDALAELAGRINAEHQQVETALRASLQHAKNAGDLLIEAKAQCQHGEWLPWLKANVAFTPRTAQNYIRLAERWQELEANTKRVSHLNGKSDTVSDLTYREALKVGKFMASKDFTPTGPWEETDPDPNPPAVGWYRDTLLRRREEDLAAVG